MSIRWNEHVRESGTGLRIENLTKRYRPGTLANDGIDLHVWPGEVFGLLGPNGAGKTTLVKQVIGLLRPTAGSIQLNGTDLIEEPDMARRLCSYLPQGALPIEALRLGEAVELTGRIRGGDARAVRDRAAELFAELQLEEWVNTFGAKLSGGVRRLTGFIMATIWPTSLVILDEPTNDVDPMRRRLLWDRIRDLGRAGTAVLLVTHNVLEAEQSVDRLAVIDGGRIVAQGTPSALKGEDRHCMRLELSLTPGAPEPDTPSFAHGRSRTGSRLRFLIDADRPTDAIDWARARIGQGLAEEYALGSSTLEDAYVRLVGNGGVESSTKTQEATS